MRTTLKWSTLALLGVALPASATFHLMKVVEVFPGTAAAPNAQYVVIQMYATGQNFVAGHAITVFNRSRRAGRDHSPSPATSPTAPARQDPDRHHPGADVLRRDRRPADEPGDLSAGGKVCWAEHHRLRGMGRLHRRHRGRRHAIQCGGRTHLRPRRERRLDIAGSATTLDAGDDTNNSANDFVATPRRRRATTPDVLGHAPAATCGNGVLQGLEQCDDDDTVNGDGCSSTCRVEAAAIPALSVANISTTEGNSGTHTATFVLRLSKPSPGPGDIYHRHRQRHRRRRKRLHRPHAVRAVIPAGATSKSFAVTIRGDTAVEPNQSFTVRLINVVGATVAKPSATCTIVNDDGT